MIQLCCEHLTVWCIWLYVYYDMLEFQSEFRLSSLA